MQGPPRQDPQDELRIDVSPDFVALCRRLDASAASGRMRALAMAAEAYEAELRTPAMHAAA